MSSKIGFAMIALLVWVFAGVAGVALAQYLYGDLAKFGANILARFR